MRHLMSSGFGRDAGQRVQVNGFDWDAPHRAPRSISWTEQWHFGAGSHNRCGSRSSEHIQKRQRHPPPSRSVNLNSLPWAEMAFDLTTTSVAKVEWHPGELYPRV